MLFIQVNKKEFDWLCDQQPFEMSKFFEFGENFAILTDKSIGYYSHMTTHMDFALDVETFGFLFNNKKFKLTQEFKEQILMLVLTREPDKKFPSVEVEMVTVTAKPRQLKVNYELKQNDDGSIILKEVF